MNGNLTFQFPKDEAFYENSMGSDTDIAKLIRLTKINFSIHHILPGILIMTVIKRVPQLLLVNRKIQESGR